MVSRYGIGRDQVKILRATVYGHHDRFAARFRMGRVFLAGDAAHAMPPWIGHMAAGVRDAASLCSKLAAVLRRELPESVLAPTRPSASRTSGKSPSGRCSSAGSSPSGGAPSPGSVTPCCRS
ncbi:FAD-dependent monooxygenase [Streptomyces sp. NPDC056660]|uniref:FAD-dependent monooxygenase n=1 Tax=Streptomyces sp. NPDC056660 TaxID=3345897 RepID=UPI00369C7DA6